MTILLTIIIIVVVFLLSITIILFVIGPTLLLQPRRRTANFYQKIGLPTSPDEIGLQYEEINNIVDNHIKLNGWLIKADPPTKGTILYLHGVGDCKIDGLRFSKFFHDNHYNIFLYDSRRHGESGGNFCTYGYYEKHDLSRIIDYLQSRTDLQIGKIGVFGTSMGAAVAIQTAAFDKRISAVAAENSFATLRSIFDDYQKRMIKIPFHYLRNLVIKRSEWIANFKANEVAPIKAVRDIHIPLLIIYAKKDRHINFKYSLMLYENTDEPKEIYAIENASHNDTWDKGGEPYRNKLLEFFNKNLL